MEKQVSIILKIALQEQKLVHAKRFHKRNIEKRKFFLFKQYINGMLNFLSSEKSRAFGHLLSTTLHNARHQGWGQEFSDGGLTLPTKGLKNGF